MKIFIDSADVREIEEALRLDVIDGVTTNPSLMSKVSDNIYDTVKNIISLTQLPISVEVSAIEYDDMIEQGNKILDIADNIVLKLPITIDGIKACKYFAKQSRFVNMTLCFSVLQALLAAKAGAKYISPFVGRLDDISCNGIDLVGEIKSIFNNYQQYDCQILAASIRNIQHIISVGLIGGDIVTAPLSLIQQMFRHPLTELGIKKFSEDWDNSKLVI